MNKSHLPWLFRCGLVAWVGGALSAAAAAPEPLATWTTRHTAIAIDDRGALTGITSLADQRNYLAAGQPAPVLSVRVDGRWHAPERARWDAANSRLTLEYGASGVTVVLRAEAKPTHVRLEVVEVRPVEPVELILWGPYPTTIGKIIGEVIGVVRDDTFAVGIQALNAKTLGGYPTQESDVESEYSADDAGGYPHLPTELAKGQHYRADTARPTDFGSVVQAFCRNRSRDRVIANWGHEKYLAPAFRDGGVVGSRIALFGCPSAAALETLGAIEVAEGLPHPLLDGVWAKQSPQATAAYLIVDFSESNVDQAIAMTKRAGLRYLYHSSPFETWGHFRLKPDLFPHGWDGLKACVEKGRAAGVRLGFHTLSNFTTPNDAYVTPRPDPRLARIGASALAADVDAAQRELPVAEPDYFRKASAMNTVMLGEELVKFGSVSAAAPWRLLECERGAWGTRPAAHARGDAVARLLDHDYKVFLTDADLTLEIARNLAKLCNHAGTLQISLDGLEGAWSTGMGQYGRTLLTHTWYEALAPELKGTINDASNPGHFNWHVYTRMNWGEPWYAGFRESQTLYRFKNQLHFERNLLPHMLGWFALRPDTSVEDAEWLLARAAGFDAGFTLAASLASTAQLEADPASAEAAREFGAVPAILEAMRQWETARMAGAFPAELKARLRDNNREFHLRPVGEGAWEVCEAHTVRFQHDAARGGSTDMSFSNSAASQPLQWVLRTAGKQPVSGVVVRLNGRSLVNLEGRTLPPGTGLVYRGGADVAVCDGAWKELERLPVDAAAAHVEPGAQRLRLSGTATGEALLKLEARTLGPAERIGR